MMPASEPKPMLSTCQRCRKPRVVYNGLQKAHIAVMVCTDENCPLYMVRIIVGDGAERLSVDNVGGLRRYKRAERYARRNARRRATFRAQRRIKPIIASPPVAPRRRS